MNFRSSLQSHPLWVTLYIVRSLILGIGFENKLLPRLKKTSLRLFHMFLGHLQCYPWPQKKLVVPTLLPLNILYTQAYNNSNNNSTFTNYLFLAFFYQVMMLDNGDLQVSIHSTYHTRGQGGGQIFYSKYMVSYIILDRLQL